MGDGKPPGLRAIIASYLLLFAGAGLILVDIAGHARTWPPTPMFGEFAVIGAFLILAGLVVRKWPR
jgi:hypothetical protein